VGRNFVSKKRAWTCFAPTNSDQMRGWFQAKKCKEMKLTSLTSSTARRSTTAEQSFGHTNYVSQHDVAPANI